MEHVFHWFRSSARLCHLSASLAPPVHWGQKRPRCCAVTNPTHSPGGLLWRKLAPSQHPGLVQQNTKYVTEGGPRTPPDQEVWWCCRWVMQMRTLCSQKKIARLCPGLAIRGGLRELTLTSSFEKTCKNATKAVNMAFLFQRVTWKKETFGRKSIYILERLRKLEI